MKFCSDYFEIIVDGNNLMFFDVSSGQITTPEGLRFDKTGVIKEFPDLENDDEWKKKTLQRLKEHLKTFDTERKKIDYVGNELEKFGNEKIMLQRAGFRPEQW